MNRVKLKEDVTSQTTVDYIIKEALWADQCEVCGRMFEMRGRAIGKRPGEMQGIFDKTPPKKGNGFVTTVCSWDCAKVMWEGVWKQLKRYQEHVEIDAKLMDVQFFMTNYLKTRDELIDEWEQREENRPTDPRWRSRTIDNLIASDSDNVDNVIVGGWDPTIAKAAKGIARELKRIRQLLRKTK